MAIVRGKFARISCAAPCDAGVTDRERARAREREREKDERERQREMVLIETADGLLTGDGGCDERDGGCSSSYVSKLVSV